MPFTHEHENPPPPFNLDFRPGFGAALSKAHQEWQEKNPDVTRVERAAAYKVTADRLRASFPSHRENGVTSPYAT